MKLIIIPFQIIYKLYVAAYFSCTLILFYPAFKILLYKKSRFPIAFRLMRFYAKTWLLSTGVFIKVKGKQNIIKNQPFIICANHSSFIDIPCMYAIFDEYFVFTGKQEIEKWPLFHIFYTSGMNILVDRNNKQGILKSFKKMIRTIDNGFPLVIFPEGTISKEAPKLTEFKSGAISLAIKKQIPVLPVTFTSNWKRLQRKDLFHGLAGPGISNVVIHPIIETAGKTEQELSSLLKKLHQIINLPLTHQYRHNRQ